MSAGESCEDREYRCCELNPPPEGGSEAEHWAWYEAHVAAYERHTSTTCFDSQDEYGRAILTVGQLKRILAHQPDHIQVVLEDDDWYVNVGRVMVPVEGSDYSCLTLEAGEAFDARQL